MVRPSPISTCCRYLLLLIATIASTRSASVSAFSASAPPAVRVPSPAAVGGSRRYTALSVSKTEENVAAAEDSTTTTKKAKVKANPLSELFFEEDESSSSARIIQPNGSITVTDEPLTSATVTTNAVALEGLAWRGVVVALCALWASNFAVAKLILQEPGVDSSLYAVSRFGVAALALLPGAINVVRKSGLDAEIAKGAAVCGSWVAFGYLGQTLGLLSTTASRSCVICSLHCVFVACIAELWRVNRANEAAGEAGKISVASFDTKRLVPAAIAVAGVAIVELQGAAGAPTIGDALSFAQPIGFGMGYLTLEELMAKNPEAALPVSAIKLIVVATASFGLFELSPLLDSGGLTSTAEGLSNLAFRLPDFGAVLASPIALGGILYTGLVTTAAALWIESIAFARVPATDASIILTTEPLFAALVGAITLGETFGTSDYVGAGLIVGGCAFAALLDNPGDLDCVIEEDPTKEQECKPERRWPFWGF